MAVLRDGSVTCFDTLCDSSPKLRSFATSSGRFMLAGKTLKEAKRMVECFFDRLIPNRKARIESSIIWVVLMLSAATFRAVNENLYSEKFPWPVVPFEIPKSKDTVSLLHVSRPRRKKKEDSGKNNVCYFLNLRLEFSVVWTLRQPWFFLSHLISTPYLYLRWFLSVFLAS